MPLLIASLAALLLAAPAALSLHAPALSGILAGRVTDADTDEFLAGVRVSLAGTRFGAVTDSRGRYRIVAPAGAYRVEARLDGYAVRAYDDVEVADGETLTLDFSLDGDYPRERDEIARPRPDRSGPPPAGPPAPGALSGAGDAGGVRHHEAEGADGRAGTAGGPGRAGLLTAGDVDDHLNWDYFLRYLRRALRRGDQALPALDLSDRISILFRDRTGQAASNARVRITPAGQRGRTLEVIAGTDGRLHVYPARDLGRGVRQVRLQVYPPSGGAPHTHTVDLARASSGEPITVRVPARAALPAALDLAIVLDVTGSMSDEHRYLTDEFESIVARVRRRYPQVDLRFGLVVYRDRGDEFVVRSFDFTSSVREMQRRLAAQRATGGGDYPEALDEALGAGLALQWRGGNTARVLFLVADAPPHDGRYEAALRHVDAARQAGVRIYPVAASGVGDGAEYLMRTAAALTQGRHLFLTDDSGIGRPHQEPSVPCFAVTSLDHQLVRVIEGELAGRRVEIDGQDLVRTVGRYDRGVCRDQPVTYAPDGQW